jgi:WXG100 family type VII secretion target
MSDGNDMELGEATLKQIANEVTSGRDAFQALAKQLSGKITEKTPQWQGAGGSAFFNLHNSWQEKHTRIVNALNEFEASLHQTDKDTKGTDQGQSSQLGTNLSALDGIPSY